MRYYNISLAGVGPKGSGWTSHPNGIGGLPDPGAQEVLMNLEVFRAGDDPNNAMTTADNSTVEVKGVSWQEIKNSNLLVNKSVQINGGMAPGLPLATIQSAHQGVLLTGVVLKAWGNWVGTEMSIQLVIGPIQQNAAPSSDSANTTSPAQPAPSSNTPNVAPSVNRTGLRSIDRMPFARGRSNGIATVNPLDASSSAGGSATGGGLSSFPASSNIGGIVSSFLGGGFPGLSSPLNLIHNMQPNMPLSGSIAQTLSTAFPGLSQLIAINPMLMLNYQDAGVYQNMAQYATYILKLSRSIMKDPNYFGVHMASHNGVNYVSDLTIPTGEGILTAYDFVGQPTWIDQQTVEIKIVMRGDIKPFQTVTIPAGTLMNVAEAAIMPYMSGQRTNVTLENMSFKVISIRHVGDFRNPDGNYWVTILQAIVQGGSSTFATIPPVQPIANNNPAPATGSTTSAPTVLTVNPPPGYYETHPGTQQFGSMFKRRARGH